MLADIRLRKAGLILGVLGIGLAGAAWLGLRARTPVELRVGVNGFPPYVIVGPGQQVSGLAVEVLEEAAKRSGIRLRYVRSGDDIDGAIRSGKIDIFPLAALTPARVSEFHTSDAWWDNEIALISPEDAPVQTAADTPGKRIGIRGLPVLKGIAARLFPRAELVTIPPIEQLVSSVCNGNVQAAFLDVRLLQSQILKGPAECVGKALHVRTVADGVISLGTLAARDSSRATDKIYEQIAELAIEGMISATASRYSVISSSQNHHMKDMLDVQRRASMFRLGLGALTAIMLVGGVQTLRIRRARVVAEESRQRFDAFMKHTPAITFIKDEGGKIVFSNCPHDSERGMDEFSSGLAKQFQERGVMEPDAGPGLETTETICSAGGEARHFLCLQFPFSGAKGARLMGAIALDITARKQAEQALRFSQFSIDRSPDLIFWIDSGMRIFYANDAAAQRLGYGERELAGMRFSEIDCGFGNVACMREMGSGGSLTIESRHTTKAGELFPVELSLNYLELDGHGFICCMSRDITARKEAERELSHQAEHDQLTGLPNRRLFETRLARCLEAAKLTGTGLAVFYFDLDGFKLVNDTHGHALGDALLQQVVRRLERRVRDCDVLARMGGDELTLIAMGIEHPASAQNIGEGLLAHLQESFTVDGHELLLTASVGASLYPRDGEDGNTLLRHADSAMYEAKREGKNRLRFFRPEMNVSVRERLELENHLRRALDRNELLLHYQPEVSLRTGQVVRSEALLRWNHPTRGLITPEKFVPIAEETGMIVPIGAWVLEAACRYTKSRIDRGILGGVAVNVSSVQFARPDFVETVVAVLGRTGLSPDMLELEVTESVVMQGVEDVAAKIRDLRELGISVSIDDFGTGYSSLSYLQKLRIDALKIDRSFIRDVPQDGDAMALTKALVSLAHSLGMKVVIEGIETRQQLEAVCALNCDMAQGFLLGLPAGPVLTGTGSTVNYELAEIA